MKKRNGVALNPLSNIHFLDHLGPISSIMHIPFLMTEEEHYQIAKKYYPEVNVQLKDRSELHSEYLFEQFDVLFLSDYYAHTHFAEYFEPLEKKYRKQMRIVHCPHGFSDKSFYLKKCAFEDIPLIYGQNMLDMLQECAVIDQLRNYVITGNYRYSYYKKHQEFYRQVVETDILPHFVKKQPIILYAPTWSDSGATTSFYEAASTILKNVPSHYNLLIKLHPNLEEDDILAVYQLMSKYEEKVNIHFLSHFPPIYPLLDLVDIYIGDMSAIGYDFILFNKPMFFIQTPQTIRRVLYQCGVEIKIDEIEEIYKIIEGNIQGDTEKFGEVRKQVYSYTFGTEKSFEAIKKDIEEACEKAR